MMSPIRVIFSIIGSSAALTIFTDTEVNVLSSCLYNFGIKQIILTSDKKNGSTRNLVWKFTKSMMATAFVRPETLATFLKNTKPPGTRVAIVLKTEKTATMSELLIQNYKKLFWFVWFMFTEDELDSRIRIPYNCEFLLVKRSPRGGYQLVEHYHIKNSSTFTNNYGYWSLKQSLILTSSSSFYSRRMNMKGTELVRADSVNGYKCSRFKLEKEFQTFWDDMSVMFNFSMRIMKDFNMTMTENIPDGTTCIWGISKQNADNDWIFCNFGVYVRLATKFRSSNDLGWKAFVTPFDNHMWAAIGVWLLLSTVAIVVVEGCTKDSLYLNIFTAFFCLCNSDPTTVHPPNKSIPLPTKLVYLAMMTVSAVIIPAYSAFILATLSIVLPMEPFRNLKEFIEDGTYKLSTVEKTFMIRYLQESEDPEIKHLHDHFFVGVDNVATSFSNLFQSLCENTQLVGIFVDTRSFRSLFQCDMYVMPTPIATVSGGFLFQKGSPFRKILSKMFFRYHERGVIYKLRSIKMSPGSKNFIRNQETNTSLNLVQMSAILLLIPLGVLLSLIILALEIWTHRRNLRWRRARKSLIRYKYKV